MKLVIFAAALAVSSAGLAQQTTTSGTVEVDARGIPVVSAPATAPAGANQTPVIAPGAVVTPAPNQSAVFTTQASTKIYPPCTKDVTDGCVQSYERGRAPN